MKPVLKVHFFETKKCGLLRQVTNKEKWSFKTGDKQRKWSFKTGDKQRKWSFKTGDKQRNVIF